MQQSLTKCHESSSVYFSQNSAAKSQNKSAAKSDDFFKFIKPLCKQPSLIKFNS